MSKKTMIIVLVLTAIAAGCFIAWGVASQSNQISTNNDIVYYYGQQCSHCKKVQTFLDENNVANKVAYTKKEVINSGDKDAASEWQQRAEECDIKKEDLGVPFVAANGKCYVGDVEVIDFFKKEAGL